MSRFSVAVEGDSAEEVREALDSAGIPSIGPSYAHSTESPDATMSVGRRVTAVVFADSEDAATHRVRDAVGDDCELGEPRPWGDR